jgi:hypothetical protein
LIRYQRITGLAASTYDDWRGAAGAAGKCRYDLCSAIPLVDEQLEQDLIIKAAIKGVVSDGFLLCNLHFSLGAKKLLFCNLLLFDRCAILFSNL